MNLHPGPVGVTRRRALTRLLGCIAAVTIVAACSRATSEPRAPSPTPQPAPRQAPPTPVDSSRVTPEGAPPAGVAFAYRAGRHRYLYAATADIILEGDTTSDSLWSTARLTLDARPSGPAVRFVGTVDSLITRSKRRGSAPPLETAATPFSVMVQRTDTRLLIPDDTSRCATPAAVARQIAELVTWVVPPVLVPGLSWSDTLSRMVCRGGVPVQLTSEAHYTVAPNDSAAAARVPIRVMRNARSTFAGTGRIGESVSFAAESVSITGELVATDTLTLSVATGAIASLSGGSELLLRVAPAGREERYRQRTRYQVVPLP